MNHLRTILAALLLAAAPAAAQTIKTLGYNTTNGNVVAATNLTFTNSLNFATNARAATRTNLGGTTVGNAVFTATNAAAARNAIGLGTFSSEDGYSKLYGQGQDEVLNTEDGVLVFREIYFGGTNASGNAATTRTNLGGTATGNAVFTATNAAAAANAIGLGTEDNVSFNTVTLLGNGDEVQLTGSHIDSISYGTLLSFEERRFAQSGTNIFSWDGGFTVTPAATFNTNVTVNGNVTTSGTLTATGNVTMSGTGNTAPNQTASSGSSLMTRDLSDDRYSFSRWFTAIDLMYLDNTTAALKAASSGNGSGSPIYAAMLNIPDGNTKFSLPIDYRIAGNVRVVSYWTDRSATNVGGTNADVAVWTTPFTVTPSNDTTSNNAASGTQVQNVFTANYGGSGNSRFYVVEQTVNFGTVSGISATNPMQIKYVELQRRATDATDTSTNNIWLSGVHIYVP